VDETTGDRRRGRGAPLVVLLIGTCLAATAVLLLLVGGSRDPADASAEAGFARDMATHHAQAAEMAFLVRDTSTDAQLRALAYDIILTQTAQRGVFMGWLQQWNLPQAASHPRMAWMNGHSHPAASGTDGAVGLALMPGMATDADLERLRGATGLDAEILFLQLMIRHHEGGVEMARALLARSTRDEVVAMARHIEQSQAGEIALMTRMLAERNARPLAPHHE
jgi:uncharacterized protein (DUF305 family)